MAFLANNNGVGERMTPKEASVLEEKILHLQAIMVAFATDGRTPAQPSDYAEQYADVTNELADAQYPNPNRHLTLETFLAYLKLKDLGTYAERRIFTKEIYKDVLNDLQSIQRHEGTSQNWARANAVLEDELIPIRAQWFKAKSFIYAPTPDLENSIKESISAVESTLKVLLNKPSGTLGSIIKGANLDPDIERLVNVAYGSASNKDFVRHGGTQPSNLLREEAEFFLEFAAASIVYIAAKLRPLQRDVLKA